MALSTKWLQHMEAWQQSGLPQATYCRQQAINVRTFSARLCEYRKIPVAEPQVLMVCRPLCSRCWVNHPMLVPHLCFAIEWVID